MTIICYFISFILSSYYSHNWKLVMICFHRMDFKKKFSCCMYLLSVYINKSRPRTLLLWWKCCRHSATTVFDVPLLRSSWLHGSLTSGSCVFSPFGLITRRGDMPHLRFHTWWRSQSPAHLVGFFYPHQFGASLNRAERPHIIFRWAITFRRGRSTRSAFSWRRRQRIRYMIAAAVKLTKKRLIYFLSKRDRKC